LHDVPRCCLVDGGDAYELRIRRFYALICTFQARRHELKGFGKDLSFLTGKDMHFDDGLENSYKSVLFKSIIY